MIFEPFLLVVVFFFVCVFPLFRFAFRLEFLDRPLVLAACWSLFFPNSANLAFFIGIFYELFWIDVFFVGTYIPPQASLAMLITLAIVKGLHLVSPAQIGVLIFLTLPFAHLGSLAESQVRKWNNRFLAPLLYALRSREEKQFQVQRAVWQGIAALIICNCSVFFVGFFTCFALFQFLQTFFFLSDLPLSWTILWFTASVSAILAIRIRAGYAALGISSFVFAVFSFLLN